MNNGWICLDCWGSLIALAEKIASKMKDGNYSASSVKIYDDK